MSAVQLHKALERGERFFARRELEDGEAAKHFFGLGKGAASQFERAAARAEPAFRSLYRQATRGFL